MNQMREPCSVLMAFLAMSLSGGCDRVEYDFIDYPPVRAVENSTSVTIALSGSTYIATEGSVTSERRGSPYTLDLLMEADRLLRVDSAVLRIVSDAGETAVEFRNMQFRVLRSERPDLYHARVDSVDIPFAPIRINFTVHHTTVRGETHDAEFAFSVAPVRTQRSTSRIFEAFRGI